MTKIKNFFKTRYLAASLLVAFVPCVASAQDYYDDDIYFSPSKAAQQKKKREAERAAREKAEAQRYMNDYTTVSAGSSMPLKVDVDSYNRNGSFLVSPEEGGDSIVSPDFAYTRRIERFHDPDVVTSTGDTALVQYYYATQATQPANINVYIVDNDPFYRPSWAWRFGISPYAWGYDPFYGGWGYDPYWSWSWGWGPSWSWGWGPGWGWGGPAWYPGYYPGGWGPSWGGPVHAWRPTSPGASRPHRPSYAGASGSGSRRPGNAYRPGSSHTPSGSVRPGNSGRGRYINGVNTNQGNNRYTAPSHNSNNNNYTRPGNSGRGRSEYNSGSSRSYNSGSYNSSGSYRSGGSGTHRSGGGGGFGGGGGGGSRGRR